jgi:hypothetical protein
LGKKPGKSWGSGNRGNLTTNIGNLKNTGINAVVFTVAGVLDEPYSQLSPLS